MNDADRIRELEKIQDVLLACDRHFAAEAQMNAALHMSSTVRPAPLAAATAGAVESIRLLIEAS